MYIYCVINEFNPTFEVQKMGNEAFQNGSFANALFLNGNESNSCLWALFLASTLIFHKGYLSIHPMYSFPGMKKVIFDYDNFFGQNHCGMW